MTRIFALLGAALTITPFCVAPSMAAVAYNDSMSVSGWANGIVVQTDPGATPAPITLTFPGISDTPSGAGTLTVDIEGNFASSSENFTIVANPSGTNYAFQSGAILNSNTGDDDFDFVGDSGDDFMGTQSGTATIPLGILNSLLSDNSGTIEFLVTFSEGVTDNIIFPPADDESITLTLDFPTAIGPSGVPEPSAFILAGIAALLLGVVAYRRRRRASSETTT